MMSYRNLGQLERWRVEWLFTGEEVIHNAELLFFRFCSGADTNHRLRNDKESVASLQKELTTTQFSQLIEAKKANPGIRSVILDVTRANPSHTYSKHLKDQLLVPGGINAHSHAFQRAIRGRTHTIDRQHLGDNFWSWRTQMYKAANQLTVEEVFAVSRVAFLEMLQAGYTSVAEFHYLHHPLESEGNAYDNEHALALAVIQAAKEVGLKITLLDTAYQTSAPGVSANNYQKRFIYSNLDKFFEGIRTLKKYFHDDTMVNVGIAAHSIRALDKEAIAASHAFAKNEDLPFHIHVCEQRQELEQCQKAYGVEPLELLESLGALTERTSLVHATHLATNDIDRLIQSAAIVVACPTTERDLGDGFLPTTDLLTARIPIAIGSDSQSCINLFEEMRCVEYHERLLRERRNVVAEALDVDNVGLALYHYLQKGGALSLRQPNRGMIQPRFEADFLSIDLSHPSMWGYTTLGENSKPHDTTPLPANKRTCFSDIISSLVLAADTSVIKHLWTDGEERLTQLRRSDYIQECREAYEAVKYVRGINCSCHL